MDKLIFDYRPDERASLSLAPSDSLYSLRYARQHELCWRDYCAARGDHTCFSAFAFTARPMAYILAEGENSNLVGVNPSIACLSPAADALLS